MKNSEKKRAGGWLPENRRLQAEWVNGLLKKVSEENKLKKGAENGIGDAGERVFKNQEVRDFAELVDKDPNLHLLAEQMVDQACEYDDTDPAGSPQIKEFGQMLEMIDYIIGTAPEYFPPEEKDKRALIGFPINAILDWCMGTQAGYAFFLDERVNKHLESILNKWCGFLCSEASVYVLNSSDSGWLCKSSLDELHMDEIICDPTDSFYGFRSWNDFFTRRFKDGARPVEDNGDEYVIVNACESQPYRICVNVQKDTKFWLKGQPYSIEYMLGHDPDAGLFIGGTVYQAFLSATRYHRWHSPVAGTVRRCFNIPGTYYAEMNTYPYDSAGPNESQGYITHVAARAVVLIDCDNTDIGLVGFIAVGMSEVSSCVLRVKEGQHLEKGDELGYFQFGGSTHCLIFRKDVIDMFVQDAVPAEDFNNSALIKVNAKLAVAKRKTKK